MKTSKLHRNVTSSIHSFMFNAAYPEEGRGGCWSLSQLTFGQKAHYLLNWLPASHRAYIETDNEVKHPLLQVDR